MPVNLSAPQANSLLPVKGVQLGFAEANIRKKNRKDVLVIKLSEGTRVVGVFTKNQFCAAPVTLCKEHLTSGNEIRALVVNTGNANAGTGEPGMQEEPRARTHGYHLLGRHLDDQAVECLQDQSIGRADAFLQHIQFKKIIGAENGYKDSILS